LSVYLAQFIFYIVIRVKNNRLRIFILFYLVLVYLEEEDKGRHDIICDSHTGHITS